MFNYHTTSGYDYLPSGSLDNTAYDKLWFGILQTDHLDDLPSILVLNDAYGANDISYAQYKNLRGALKERLFYLYVRQPA